MDRRILAAALALALPSCDGARAPSGLTEPLRVRSAMFEPGPLPGTPPPPDGGDGDDDASAPGPQVTALDNANGVVTPGQSGKAFSGRTTPDAFAIALRFVGQGTGYWVLPVGGQDPSSNNERVFQLAADLAVDLPPGLQTVRFAAIDGDGGAGPQRDVPLCVASLVPDNLNACDPSLAPPAAVVSLFWDNDVDLDLELRTPEGKTVDWDHPSTAQADGGVVDRDALAAPGVGTLDRNSNANCALDGVRREDVVWQQPPAPGTYLVYANLFSACGQPSTRFHVAVYRSEPADDGAHAHLVETARRDGELPASAANGGASLGLYVTEVTFP